MRTILAATDYTNASSHAVKYAAALAHHIQAKIILFNSFELPDDPNIYGGICPHLNKRIDENKIRLNEYANEISRHYEIEVNWFSKLSFVEEEIDRQVVKLQADLVVMGMKKKATEYPFFGSTTTAIISKGKYPVLVVPEDSPIKEPSRLLFACDYKCLKSNHQLPLLKEIAQAFKARVEVLHVEKPKEQLLSQPARESGHQGPNVEGLLDGVPHFYRDLTEKDVVSGIERSIKEYEADMLVMVPHKKGFWNGLLQRSTTRKMALKTRIPLLCLPNLPQ